MDPIDALEQLVKGNPPPGFSPIPGGRKGGFRKRVGVSWQYWYPNSSGSKPSSAREPEMDTKTLAIRADFEKAIRDGKLKGTFAEHVTKAREFLSKHTQDREALVSDLKGLASEGATIQARTKTVDSALGKMVRKPKYQDASMLQDGTGARIILNSVDEVKNAVSELKKKYKVIEEDDYIQSPQGDYRSHHLIIEHRGLQKEIQVRTRNQDSFANWSHDVYKPLNEEQEAVVKSHVNEIQVYSKRASDFYWLADQGKDLHPPHPPPCPPVIGRVFGCLEFGGTR